MTKKLLKIQNQPFAITQSILSLYSALRPCFQQIWIVLDNTLMVNREQCQKNDIHYQYVSFLAGIPPKVGKPPEKLFLAITHPFFIPPSTLKAQNYCIWIQIRSGKAF